MNQHVQSGPGPQVNDKASSADAQALLLTEVDFKWLMAGQGWWINLQRLNGDPCYAAGILRSALASPCIALRECAALLQLQLSAATIHQAG